MQQNDCLNCEIQLNGNQKFCSNCGQKTAIHRLSFHEFSHDVIHHITHADKSIFTLLQYLILKPGIIAREYVAGKRQKYFKPLNFFFIVAGIVVFMTSSLYKPDDSRSKQMEMGAQHIKDPVKKQQLLDIAARNKKVNMIAGKYSNVINMIATPFLTLLFWLFYRIRYNYFECLIANMYFVGFIMLVYALLIVPLRHFFPAMNLYLIAIFFLIEIIYRGYAYYEFINLKGRWNFVKAYGISLFISALWLTITYSLIVRYISKGF